MKRLLTLALLTLFLFNVVGYYMVYWGLHYHASVELNQRLDAEAYAAEETVTFKVPLTAPYYSSSNDYERVSGSFENHGEFYQLVKQKFEGDTLYIVCIKDTKEKKLFAAMTDFVKLSSDLPSSSKETLKLLGSFIKDYVPGSVINTQAHQGWSIALSFIPQNFDLLGTNLPVLSPPPDSRA